MKHITTKAPSKINIGLNIVSKRNDDFHNLETFFYPIKDLYDILTFEENKEFEFISNSDFLNDSDDNLIIKDVKLLESKINYKFPVKISLEKRIPIGAGLGGGSSDAAATLNALNDFFSLGLELNQLNRFALTLGSDVPFFIKSIPAVGYSRGEILHESKITIPYTLLIVNPGIHISTKEAFEHIVPKPSVFDYKYFIESNDIDFTLLADKLTNDFEKYVFKTYPEIKKIKNTLLEQGALFCQMSGTGSTVYGIFNNENTAKRVSEMFPEHYFKFISNYLSINKN